LDLLITQFKRNYPFPMRLITFVQKGTKSSLFKCVQYIFLKYIKSAEDNLITNESALKYTRASIDLSDQSKDTKQNQRIAQELRN
jgi:hypothetical protein